MRPARWWSRTGRGSRGPGPRLDRAVWLEPEEPRWFSGCKARATRGSVEEARSTHGGRRPFFCAWPWRGRAGTCWRQQTRRSRGTPGMAGMEHGEAPGFRSSKGRHGSELGAAARRRGAAWLQLVSMASGEAEATRKGTGARARSRDSGMRQGAYRAHEARLRLSDGVPSTTAGEEEARLAGSSWCIHGVLRGTEEKREFERQRERT